MAAPTTIHDLPDDMLHEIFGHVFAAELEGRLGDVLYTHMPPEGAHAALRDVCRRWRDIADWVRLSTALIGVQTVRLADVGAVRARHPAAFKRLALAGEVDTHSTDVSRAAASLINGSADLRRALLCLELHTCCLPTLLPALTPVASCTALTELRLYWKAHKKGRVVPSNILAPLSALRRLKDLVLGQSTGGKALPETVLLAPLPALPEISCLTLLHLYRMGNFVPVGSDAALGRLRRLFLLHRAPVQELLDVEDPFFLRAAFDAGTWQPSRLTGLQELGVTFDPVRDDVRAPRRPSPTGSRPGSEWAPLAGQVTSLEVSVESGGYNPSSTGIVAGLGALTALRDLRVVAKISGPITGWLEPVSLDRVRAPHLTFLWINCTVTPVNAARFPNLVYLHLASGTRQPPLNLRSLVARSSLKALQIGIQTRSPGSVNLAELFVGGAGWPVLKQLVLHNIALEWDATDLAGAPTAVEFAERARQLLPALIRVKIDEPRGRDALPDRARVAFVVACRRHVVPALKGMHTGGEWSQYVL